MIRRRRHRLLALLAIPVLLLGSGACSATVSAAHTHAHAQSSGTSSAAPHGPSLLQSPLRVLIVGDSLTSGVGASDPAVTSYAPLIVASLRTREASSGRLVVATVLGYRGHTALEMLDALQHGTSALAADATYDIIVIEAGTNDWYFTAPDAFPAAYTQLVAAVSAHLPRGPSARLVCLTTWERGHPPMPPFILGTNINTWGIGAAPYDAAIGAVCHAAHSGASVVRLAPLFDVPSDHSPTDHHRFHPSDTGYAQIAAAVLADLA